jgi:hypothetical protein
MRGRQPGDTAADDHDVTAARLVHISTLSVTAERLHRDRTATNLRER